VLIQSQPICHAGDERRALQHIATPRALRQWPCSCGPGVARKMRQRIGRAILCQACSVTATSDRFATAAGRDCSRDGCAMRSSPDFRQAGVASNGPRLASSPPTHSQPNRWQQLPVPSAKRTQDSSGRNVSATPPHPRRRGRGVSASSTVSRPAHLCALANWSLLGRSTGGGAWCLPFRTGSCQQRGPRGGAEKRMTCAHCCCMTAGLVGAWAPSCPAPPAIDELSSRREGCSKWRG
jgi:hypothetical protein